METTSNLQLKSNCVQCLGSLAKYSSDHCKNVQEYNVLESLLLLSKQHTLNDQNLKRLFQIYSKKKETISNRNASQTTQIGEEEIKLSRALEMFQEVCEVSIQQIIRNSLSVDSLIDYLTHPKKNKISLNLCLKQLFKTLNSDAQAKKSFAKKKGLEHIMKVTYASEFMESNVKKMANEVLGLYPDDLVKLFKPDYPKLLLKKLDDFQTVE